MKAKSKTRRVTVDHDTHFHIERARWWMLTLKRCLKDSDFFQNRFWHEIYARRPHGVTGDMIFWFERWQDRLKSIEIAERSLARYQERVIRGLGISVEEPEWR